MAHRSNGFKKLNKVKAPKHLTSSVVPPSREPLQALTTTQGYYCDAIKNYDHIVAIGPAGTGKTYIPSIIGIDMLLDKVVDKIVVTRPVMGAGGEELGYFPGDENEKYSHWTRPVIDAFEQRAGKHTVKSLMYHDQIELAPLSLMRGRTLDNAFVIVDEAQNMSWALMKMLLTRMGKNTQLVVTGDLNQSDIRGLSGLQVMLNIILEQSLPVPVIEFNSTDVVRSELCALWVAAIERYENG